MEIEDYNLSSTLGQIVDISTESVGPNGNSTNENQTLRLYLDCDTPFPPQYHVIPSVICVFVFIFGVLFALFGYRLLKAAMFLSGFMFGSSIVYFVCVEEGALPPLGKVGVSLGAGLICGLVSMLVLYVGLFTTGFDCGLLLALILFVIVEFFYHPVSKWIPIGIIPGIAAVFGILVLRWQRTLAMLATGVIGSALMLLAVDYFLDAFRMSEHCYDRLTARHSIVTVCWFSWLLLAIWLPLSVFSFVLQWRVTASKYDHRSKGTETKGQKNPRRRMIGSETDPHRYRQLYQIRRMNGDVISSGYIKDIGETVQSPSLQLLSQSTEVDDVVAIQATLDDADVTVTPFADPGTSGEVTAAPFAVQSFEE